jgi:RND family efflux transporter MFP subunit
VKRIAGLLVILLVLAGGGWAFWKWRTASPGGPAAAASLPDLTAKVKRRTIESAVEVSGDVNPEIQIEVKAEVSAKIRKLPVKLGDKVEQDQLLVELDDRDLITEKTSALTQIEGAKFELDKAQRDYERNQRLYDKKLVSDQAFSDSKTALDVAQNTYERVQTQLRTVEDKLIKTKVLAPLSGTVLSLPVVEGQVAIAAASVNSGTLLMTLANLSRLIIATHINQIDVARLKEGMPVEFTVDSLGEDVMKGQIATIAPIATVKNNIKGFAVTVLIANPDARLRPGMTADLTIPVEKAENVLAVPLSAVFSQPDGGKVVYVSGATPETPPETRKVEAGLSNINYVEIKSGLREDETVLLTKPAGPAGSRP